MAIKKYLRRKKRRKAELKCQPFFQSDLAHHEMTEGNVFFHPCEEKVQAKMKVSEPGDKQEKEADQMAETVVHKKDKEDKEDKLQRASNKEDDKLNKKEDDKQVTKKTEEEEKMNKKEDESHDKDQQEDHTIATKTNGAPTVASSPVQNKTAHQDSGKSLGDHTISEMSNSFGYDFGTVKIHTDRNAEALAAKLNAQAFTYKGEIYFSKNKFDPSSEEGKLLLAHELTHVVQQSKNLSLVQQKINSDKK